MKQIFFRGRGQKVIGLFLLVFFFSLGVHFHEHDTLIHFHLHDFSLKLVHQAWPNGLTDGHICPCHIAVLDMPMLNMSSMVISYKTDLIIYCVTDFSLPLTWEIFHPPQTV